MKLTLSPLKLKPKENLEVGKQELRQTLQQVKLLKIKTNQKILDYQKTNEQQRKEIESLNEKLKIEIIHRQALLNENQSLQQLNSRLQKVEYLNQDLQNQINEKALLIDYLRNQTEDFQKKYYNLKDLLQQKNNQIEQMKKQKRQYEARVDRINNLLGTQNLSDFQQFSFLQNSNLVAYLQSEKTLKLQTQNDMSELNQQLIQKNLIVVELKQQTNQLKELLELANQKSQMLIENQRNLKSIQTELRHQISTKSLQMSKINEETFLLKSSMLSFGEEIQRQKQIIKEYTFRQEEEEKESELHRQYNLLIDQMMSQKDEFSIVNSQIQMLELFKAQHQNNINKVKFLCEQLDSY